MTKITPEQFVAALEDADVFVVDDSPYLHSYNAGDNVEIDLEDWDTDDEILTFNWHDDEGLMFETIFTKGGIAKAKIDEVGRIFLPNHTGEPSCVELYRLQRIKPGA